MANVTNYVKNFKTIRLFFRNLAIGIHSRHTATKRGIKKSLHDATMKRLSYFNLSNKIQATPIGSLHIHTIDKQDFYWGHNYLCNLYSLYAMKPETIVLIMAILDTIYTYESCNIATIYTVINDNTDIVSAYQNFLIEKYKGHNKSIPSIIEKQMLQRLLKRLVAIGVITEKSENNQLTYQVTSIALDRYTSKELNQLAIAIFFYKNIALLGVSGHTLLEKIDSLLCKTSLLESIENPSTPEYHRQYIFTYNNPIHIIDEQLLHKICHAIIHRHFITINFHNPRRPNMSVNPIRIESDYLGNRDYLVAYHKDTRVTLRIDSINSISIQHNFHTIPEEHIDESDYKTTLHLHFFKHPDYESKWNDFLSTFHQTSITILENASTHIDVLMKVQDGQVIIPVLRTFLPYLKITHSDPKTLQSRFIDNLLHTQHTIVGELPSYSKKTHPSWNLTSPSSLETDSEVASPLLHEISAITFTTQYRIQQDLILGIPYTLEDIQYITQHRPLLDSLSPVEENDQYEQHLPAHLVITKQNQLYPLFPNLPPILLSHTERMFLKDLLADDRVNWMLPTALKNSLIHKLRETSTSLPDHAWNNISLCTHHEPSSFELHRLCTQALEEKKQILCETSQGKSILLPCKLEYNVATNAFSLIAYSEVANTFHYYPMDSIERVTILDSKINLDIYALYNDYQGNNQECLVFSIYDINNALDRCLQAFSHYEILGTQTESMVFTFTVNYLPFQEKDILRILLSLGAAIRVQGNHPIKDKLTSIYTQAISQL
ncbi:MULTISPECIES: WYL domain-containing protein [unclassified Veillonella]|uniref:WYL domain-containing protein n=1 Tax=unclassified Veillonella TaxID=2630086 RepID=UPI0013E06965|nr:MULTISPECIES: WYL domain-containing protein [unclassified Veillonella]